MYSPPPPGYANRYSGDKQVTNSQLKLATIGSSGTIYVAVT